MDATGVGITIGLCLAVPYLFGSRLKNADSNPATIITLFLSGLGFSTCYELIRVAYSGNTKDLPTDWRTYVCVAAVATLYIAGDYVWKTYARLCRAIRGSKKDPSKA